MKYNQSNLLNYIDINKLNMVSDSQLGSTRVTDTNTFSSNAGVIVTGSATAIRVVTKHVKCVQLDKDKYFSWETKFSAMLRGFELMGMSRDLTTASSRREKPN